MIRITIETDNAAFSEDEGGIAAELRFVLRQVPEKIDALLAIYPDESSASLRDSNGTTVGKFEVLP